MAFIPESVRETVNSLALQAQGLVRFHQGKVRDSYDIPGRSDIFAVVATDRVSIFNFVLGFLIPFKGEVLTALTHFWLTTLLRDLPNHFVWSEQFPGFNAAHDLKLQYPAIDLKRTLVVKRCAKPKYELIFRHCVGGSVYDDYRRGGEVAGQQLPPGLPKWAMLESPIFTPSTKADEGDDVNITVQRFREEVGLEKALRIENLFGTAYKRLYDFSADRDVLFLDSKMEGEDEIIDEVGTPDSSRFVRKAQYMRAMAEGKEAPFEDKEFVRIHGASVPTPWGIGIGPKKLDPENPEHQQFVGSVQFPEEIIAETSKRYLGILDTLVGCSLQEYWREMGIEE